MAKSKYNSRTDFSASAQATLNKPLVSLLVAVSAECGGMATVLPDFAINTQPFKGDAVASVVSPDCWPQGVTTLGAKAISNFASASAFTINLGASGDFQMWNGTALKPRLSQCS